MTKAEKKLREYLDFGDINGSEPIEILPLTVVSIIEEYSAEKIMELRQIIRDQIDIIENLERKLEV